MSSLSNKISILKQAKYHYHFDRDLYFSKRDKKVFSVESIEDHNEKWLSDRLNAENPDNDGWTFYTNEPISDELKNKIKREIDEEF